MRIKKATFKHIEAEIYAYEDTLKQIDRLRTDIIMAGRQEDGMVINGEGYMGSTVERRATRLADSILLREMERITEAIQEVYRRSKDEIREMAWVRYGLSIDGWRPSQRIIEAMDGRNRHDMTMAGMAMVLSVDESTFRRYRNGFVQRIADRLGWY